MALTITPRGTLYSTSAATSYAETQTWTPSANSLCIAFITQSAATLVTPTGVSGHGIASWTDITSSFSASDIGTTHRLHVFVAQMGASPTSAATTITYSSNRTGTAMSVYEITGHYIGAAAANSFRNHSTNNGTGATSGSITLGAAANGENRPLAVFVHLANEVATTPRTNWTESSSPAMDGAYGSPSTAHASQYRSDAFETTASATWTTTSNWRGHALEVISGSPVVTPPVGEVVFAGAAATRVQDVICAVGVGAIAFAATAAPELFVGQTFTVPTGAILTEGTIADTRVGPFTVQLREGTSTVIAEWTADAGWTPETWSWDLTAPQAAAITDWTDLRIRVTASNFPKKPVLQWALLRTEYGIGESPPAGAVVFSGLAPTISIESGGTDIPRAPGVGTLTWEGLAPVRVEAHLRSPATGAVVAEGTAPVRIEAHLKATGVGTVELVGATASRVEAHLKTPAVGTVLTEGAAPARVEAHLKAPTPGAVVWEGLAPTVSQEGAVSPGVGALQWEGLAPTRVVAIVRSPAVGEILTAGATPARVEAHLRVPGVGEVVVGGVAPTRLEAHLRSPATGTVLWEGLTPTVSGDGVTSPGVGAVVWEGVAPTRLEAHLRGTTTGAVQWEGLAPVASVGVARGAGVGEVVFAGTTATLARTIGPSVGAVVWEGLAPALLTSVTAVPGPGDVVFVGIAPTMQIGVGSGALEPGVGTVQFEGVAPTIAFAPSIAWVVSPGVGEVLWGGLVPEISLPKLFSPGVGTLRIEGVEVFAAPSERAGMSGSGGMVVGGGAVAVGRSYRADVHLWAIDPAWPGMGMAALVGPGGWCWAGLPFDPCAAPVQSVLSLCGSPDQEKVCPPELRQLLDGIVSTGGLRMGGGASWGTAIGASGGVVFGGSATLETHYFYAPMCSRPGVWVMDVSFDEGKTLYTGYPAFKDRAVDPGAFNEVYPNLVKAEAIKVLTAGGTLGTDGAGTDNTADAEVVHTQWDLSRTGDTLTVAPGATVGVEWDQYWNSYYAGSPGPIYFPIELGWNTEFIFDGWDETISFRYMTWPGDDYADPVTWVPPYGTWVHMRATITTSTWVDGVVGGTPNADGAMRVCADGATVASISGIRAVLTEYVGSPGELKLVTFGFGAPGAIDNLRVGLIVGGPIGEDPAAPTDEPHG